MGLDAQVRCNCVREGKAKPCPVAELLRMDEENGPELAGTATEEQSAVYKRWLSSSCPHGGSLTGFSLGNAPFIHAVAEWLESLEMETENRFPMLLERVVYDGTHTGDHVSADEARYLLLEVETLLKQVPMSEPQRQLMDKLRQLCHASLMTGNAIQF